MLFTVVITSSISRARISAPILTSTTSANRSESSLITASAFSFSTMVARIAFARANVSPRVAFASRPA